MSYQTKRTKMAKALTKFLIMSLLLTCIVPIYTTQSHAREQNDKTYNDQLRYKFIYTAKKYLGTPYRYGGLNGLGMDCSGFVYKVAKLGADIQIPRSANNMAKFAKKINSKFILHGDLVFFARNKKIFHVGIYLGNNEFIHVSKKAGVIVSKLTQPYWKNTYAFAGRIIH